MNTRLRTVLLLLAALATVFTLAVGPAVATESGPAGEDGNGKVGLPETQHDQLGLILLGLTGLAVLGAGINAVQQLKGRRPQTQGRFRWR